MSGALLPFFKTHRPRVRWQSCFDVSLWQQKCWNESMSRCVLIRLLLIEYVCREYQQTLTHCCWNVTLGLSIFGISVEGNIYFLGLNEGVERGALKKYLHTVEYSRLILDDPGTESFIVASRSRDLHEKFNSESVSLPSPLQGSPTSLPHTGIPPTCASSNIFEDI